MDTSSLVNYDSEETCAPASDSDSESIESMATIDLFHPLTEGHIRRFNNRRAARVRELIRANMEHLEDHSRYYIRLWEAGYLEERENSIIIREIEEDYRTLSNNEMARRYQRFRTCDYYRPTPKDLYRHCEVSDSEKEYPTAPETDEEEDEES